MSAAGEARVAGFLPQRRRIYDVRTLAALHCGGVERIAKIKRLTLSLLQTREIQMTLFVPS